jgi:hypothetical protein
MMGIAPEELREGPDDPNGKTRRATTLTAEAAALWPDKTPTT